MEISGAIGVIKLKRKFDNFEKKIIIFSDNHNNSNYCKENFDNDINNIKKYMQKKKFTSQILLEEVYRNDNTELKELWPNNKHTQELKNFYLMNKNDVIPIDIRQYLYTFSWELMDESDNYKNILIKDYLKNFIDFFNYKNVIPDLSEKMKKLIVKKTGILNYFKKVKIEFLEILKNINLNDTLINHKNKFGIKHLQNIDEIANKIMDWYTIVNLFLTREKTIIHAGLHHTQNITKILKNDFNFIEYYSNGLTDYSNYNDEKSCIFLTED